MIKEIKGKTLQPRIFHLARLSFRFDGDNKSCVYKQKLTEFTIIKPALQQILKEIFKVGRKKEITSYN